MIFKILNHLGLLEEEPAATSGRSPPDTLVASAAHEIVYEPFYDDLEPDEVPFDRLRAFGEELMMAAADVGRN